ncbi:TetR/AcrR family transcriptional regulator [Paenibacillus sp. NPDC057886]|uniref:TetR/AcrR family transcriptional regulator n=1 Tax=Paenibacillus sp. NPDC057886 TaxID=3346270 RepID=UPI003677F6AE
MGRYKEFEENVVLDKAMKLFWEQGYEKTSMTDLVEHMGIHRRSLYDTFGDKHTLFLKAMDRFRTKVNSELAGIVKGSETAVEALQLIISYMIYGNEDTPSGCLMVNSAVELAMRDVDVDSKATESFTLVEQLFKDIILWGQKNGELTLDYDAGVLAAHLNAVGIGLRAMARTSIPKENLQRTANISIKLLTKYL